VENHPHQPGQEIVVTENGPYVVTGGVALSVQVIGTNAAGESWEWEPGEDVPAGVTYALCRCGRSGKAPFCDGTHAKVDFDGAETASREPYDTQKAVQDGATLILEDVRSLCAEARFCDAVKNVWDSLDQTDDPAVRERVLKEVARCPSGRLIVLDKGTGQRVEPELPPSIGVVQDPSQNCSGPLWVRGGIPLRSQEGASYEARNRMTLCRCGQSANKPFCDGSHLKAGYRDGMPDNTREAPSPAV